VFTPDGLRWLASWIAEEVQGGWLVVSDGAGNSEVSEIQNIEVRARVEEEGATPDSQDGYSVVCSASFDEQAANFEWAKRSVKLKSGTVIESNEDDGGRKVEGAIWTAEVEIQVVG
jgi:hypothetical protein